MTNDQVNAILAEAIGEIEALSGREPPILEAHSRPVVDMLGWDSLLGLEATVLIESKLGISIEADSLFVTEGTKPRARTVTQIISAIQKLMRASHTGTA